MLHRDESVGINRLQVVGPDGENIGGVEAMYVDGATNEPAFALVGIGFFRLRHSFVPMEGARTEGDELHVRYAKDIVKDAPYVHPDERIDDREAAALYEHFGLEPPTRDREPEAHAPHEETAHPAPVGPSQAQSAEPEPAEPEPAEGETAERETAEREPAGPEPSATADEQVATEPSPIASGPTGVVEDEDRRETAGERTESRDRGPGGAESPAATAAGGRDDDMARPAARASGDREPAAPAPTAEETGPAPEETRTAPEDGPAPEDRTSLEDRTVDELRQMASEHDIPGRSSMNKGELVEALSRRDGGEQPSGADRAYEDRTVDELRQLAADRDIPGRSSMNKRELIKALQKH